MRIEITLSWHMDVVEVHRLDDVDRFSVGMRAEDDLFVPLAHGPSASHTLLARAPDGRVWLWPLAAAPIALDAHADHELSFGAFTVRVRSVAREQSIALPPVTDTRFANISTVTAASTVALIAMFVLTPAPVRAAVDPLPMGLLRAWVTTRVTPPITTTPTTTTKDPRREPATRPPAPKRSGPGDRARDARVLAADALSTLALFATAGALEADDDLGRGAAPGSLAAALDAVGPARIAGLALLAGGLGGASTETLAIGALRGRFGDAAGADTNERALGPCGALGCKDQHEVTMAQGAPVLLCGRPEAAAACDSGKELIRRVVQEHRDQLRYCFESALLASPGLGGKASLAWTVTASGSVMAVSVVDSDLPRAVGGCLADKVRTWRFPPVAAWRDGVVVRYPFVFRQGA